MDRMTVVVLGIYLFGVLTGAFIGYSMADNSIFNNESIIHVVISPVMSSKGAPYSGDFAVYYDDYFDVPTSHWKKGIEVSNDLEEITDMVEGNVNFVSSKVVVVMPTFLNLTFNFNKEVEYQYYG